MNKKAEVICKKMVGMIENSDDSKKDFIRRYLSLANRELHEISNAGDMSETFGIIGASMAIKNRYIDKFGFFSCKSSPVLKGERKIFIN